MAMPAESVSHLVTAEELLQLDVPGKVTELVRGRLLVHEPPSTWHGSIAAKLLYLIADHVYRQELGIVCSQDTGFKLASNPDTVRAPDVAFVSRARADKIPRRGYAPLAPDLAVEIISPGDRPGELLAKVADWLNAGVSVVWVIDSERAEARIYRDDGEVRIIAADGDLDGGVVLPGFTCKLAEVLR